GIIRFRRAVRNGALKRYILIEKMRQTNHSLQMYEIAILPGKGLTIVKPVEMRKEDISLPKHIMERVQRASERREAEIP
ncbi:MAG: ATPase domain-containing protein, partial [Candidatus Bathyarchaeia archaeon]